MWERPMVANQALIGSMAASHMMTASYIMAASYIWVTFISSPGMPLVSM